MHGHADGHRYGPLRVGRGRQRIGRPIEDRHRRVAFALGLEQRATVRATAAAMAASCSARAAAMASASVSQRFVDPTTSVNRNVRSATAAQVTALLRLISLCDSRHA